MLVNTKSWKLPGQGGSPLDYSPVIRNFRAMMLYYLQGELASKYFRDNPFREAWWANDTVIAIAHPYNVTDKLLRGVGHLC